VSAHDVERERFVARVLKFPLGSMANGLLEQEP